MLIPALLTLHLTFAGTEALALLHRIATSVCKLLYIAAGASRTSWLNGLFADQHPDPEAYNEDKVFLYSALYDATDGQLQVLLEAHPTMLPSTIVSCMLQGQNRVTELEPIVTPFSPPPSPQSEWADFWIIWKVICLAPPAWIVGTDTVLTVQLRPNDLTVGNRGGHQQVPVEHIEITPASRIGACLSPLFTETPTFHDWMKYHSEAGVFHSDIYVPHGEFIESANYTARLGAFPNPGMRGGLPMRIMHSRYSIGWHEYHPLPNSYYFGQMITFNDCIFRNRRKFEYLLMLDIDEFVVLSEEEGSLADFLDSHLTSEFASVRLAVFPAPVHCPVRDGIQTYSGIDVFADRQPNLDLYSDHFDWYAQSKTIIRPLQVLNMHVHGPLAATPQTKLDKLISPSIAGFRHVRCGSW